MNIEVIVLIGLPGSGKSTWAKQSLIEDQKLRQGEPWIICSADSFFQNNGEYKFDRTKLGEAHKKCLRDFTENLIEDVQFFELMNVEGYNPHLCKRKIIVDNTNLSLEEISPYISLGQAYADNVRVLLFDCSKETSFKRNIHNVPEDTIDSMTYRLGHMISHWPKRWPKIETINTEEVENEVRI